MRFEQEMGLTPGEIVANLERDFRALGYTCSHAPMDEGNFRFVARSPAGVQVTVALRRLPDRAIGPTLRFPRTQMVTEVDGADEAAVAAVCETIRRALLRGGG
jgi:hypothetical protein